MKTVAVFCVFTIMVASVHGGSKRLGRQGGWGAPPAVTPTNINAVGASQAAGWGGSVAEHEALLSVSGSPDVPALLNLGIGSNVGLSQSASNYQSSQIGNDGSSSAYQGNYASNDAYGGEYLYGNAQGLNITSLTAGWSATEGEGEIVQADSLEHNGPGASYH